MSDVKPLLARVNLRLAELRRALAHDHRDDAWWAARDLTAALAQRERARLRGAAHRLHVERATARGRVHCPRFASLDEQRAWLATHARELGAV